jgi:FkbM family methyltransferase
MQRNLLWPFDRRWPRVVELTDFDSSGVRFEVRTRIEHFRVVRHGAETKYIEMMLGLLRPSDSLLDVGASVGLVALHAARLGLPVVAVEPDPHYRGRLRHNLSLNPGLDIEILDCAIADFDGRTELHFDYPGGYSPSLSRQGRHRRSHAVSVRSIDSLIATKEIAPPTVMKLDVEGAEWLALRGADDWLSGPDRPRAIFLEAHPDFIREFGGSTMEILARLWALGYRTDWESGRAGQLHLVLMLRGSQAT